MNPKTFRGTPADLRSPERRARLEVDRVVGLLLDGIAPQSALDIGTGGALFASAFTAAGLRVTGVDINAVMVESARIALPQARFEIAEADRLPFDDESFDLVYLGHVLHETDDPAVTLKEAYRVCRVRTAVLEWPYLDQPVGPPLSHRLSPDAVQVAADRAGFSVLQTFELTNAILYRMDR